MESLKSEDIEALLDVTELEPGTYTRQLTINLPNEKYELVGIVNIQFVIVDKNQATEDGSDQLVDMGDEQPSDTGNGPEEDPDSGADDDTNDNSGNDSGDNE